MSPRSKEARMSDPEEEQASRRSKRASPTQEDAPEHPRQKKRRAPGVFDESGLTDQQRRELRRSQRQLHDTIRQDRREALPSGGTAATDDNDEDDDDDSEKDEQVDFLQSARQQNNVLFETVLYTREAVLDAENVDLIAQKYVQQVERLVQVPRYDPVKLVHKLVSKCTIQSQEGSSCFDWRTLGAECGICFNAVPEGVSFLAGPLDALLTQPTEKKARVVRQRAVAEAGEEVKPEQVQGGGKEKENVDQLSALLKQMKKKLRERCTSEFNASTERAAGDKTAETEKLLRETGMEVDGVQLLFNPDSFTQTVENIFHYSFMIKKGEAAIGVRTKRSSALEESSQSPESTSGFAQHQGLWVKPAVKNDLNEESRQAVVAFTMKDWRALVQGYDLQQGDLPHRPASKNSAGTGTAATAPTQSQESVEA